VKQGLKCVGTQYDTFEKDHESWHVLATVFVLMGQKTLASNNLYKRRKEKRKKESLEGEERKKTLHQFVGLVSDTHPTRMVQNWGCVSYATGSLEVGASVEK
jgi:hypothetical protein